MIVSCVLCLGVVGAVLLYFYSSNDASKSDTAEALTGSYTGTGITVNYDISCFTVNSAVINYTESKVNPNYADSVAISIDITPLYEWIADSGVTVIYTINNPNAGLPTNVYVSLTRSGNVWTGSLDSLHAGYIEPYPTVTFDSSLVNTTSTYAGTGITVSYDISCFVVNSAVVQMTCSDPSGMNYNVAVTVDIRPLGAWVEDSGLSVAFTSDVGRSYSVDLTRSGNIWSGSISSLYLAGANWNDGTVTFDSSLVDTETGELNCVISSDVDYETTNTYVNDDWWEGCYDSGKFGWEPRVGTNDYYITSTNEGVADSLSGFSLSFTTTQTEAISVTYYVGCDGDFYIVADYTTYLYFQAEYTGQVKTVSYQLDAGENVFEFYNYCTTASSDGNDFSQIGSIFITKDVIFLDEQGGWSDCEAVQIVSGAAMPSITIPTMRGYTFGGYYTGTNGSGTQYYKADGTSAKTCDLAVGTTLYAKWTANKYTITLDNQSATTAGTTSVTATYGAAMPSITVPKKTGYIFCGYYNYKNGAGSKYYTADGTSARNLYTTSTTFYAYWITWYKISSVTGTTSTYTIYADSDENTKFTTLVFTPATGNVISQFSFDNTNWYAVEYTSGEICDTSIAVKIAYSANENLNSLVLEFKGLMTTNTVPIYLKTVSGAYSGLKTASSITGVNISATYGGAVTLLGDDFENLADTAEIVVSADLVRKGYKFVCWQDASGNTLSTTQTTNFTKSQVMDSVIIAVFEADSNDSVNGSTGN